MIIDHLYDSPQNVHWYHLGYFEHPIYQEFYDWLRTVKVHYDYSDMPHHCFVLLHETDRLEMHHRFAEYIGPLEESEFYRADYVDLTVPADPTSADAILMTMLNDAISKEISKEINDDIIQKTVIWSPS
jgi:hypothetical protein